MKKTFKIISVLIFLIIIIDSVDSIEIIKNHFSINKLWNKTVEPYLEDSLWLKRDIYDAGHYLMVPLHSAFKLNKKNWQKQFFQHFSRFIENKHKMDKGRLNRLHYFYLTSEFIILAKESNKYSTLRNQLFLILYQEIDSLWLKKSAWQWAHKNLKHKDFPSMRERVYWKLDNNEIEEQTYYRAIIDEEKFTIAIAANLKYYLILSDKDSSKVINDIINIGYLIFKRRVIWQNDGGWLFQPGVWYNHSDYKYSGNLKKEINIKPSFVDNIAEDVSHSHRFPLWLTSLQKAFCSDSTKSKYFLKLRKGLEKQFFNKVLIKPNTNFKSYRTNNFMDGYNGIFRWKYSTMNGVDGYGPYELSGTILLGWWSFLESKRIRKVYKYIGKCFPMNENLLTIYKSRTTRKRHPIVEQSDTNGFKELICKLASKI